MILTALASTVIGSASLLSGAASAQPVPSDEGLRNRLAQMDQSGISAEYAQHRRFNRPAGGFNRPGGYHRPGFAGPRPGMVRPGYRPGFAGPGYRPGYRPGYAYRPGYRPYPAYGYYRPYRYDYGGAAAAGAVGLATGAIVGGAIAAQNAAPVGSSAVSYCAQRFKSYDPASGTYLGYDGQRHACP